MSMTMLKSAWMVWNQAGPKDLLITGREARTQGGVMGKVGGRLNLNHYNSASLLCFREFKSILCLWLI